MDEDKRKLSEKIEGGLDEALYKAQNAAVGQNDDGTEGVPYTMKIRAGFAG